MAERKRVAARTNKEPMNIERFLESSQHALSTKITYKNHLIYVNTWLIENDLSIEDLTVLQFERFLKSRKGWRSRNTHKNCLDALKAYLKFSKLDHDLLSYPIRRVSSPPGRKITIEQVRVLIEHCPDSHAGLQMRAILHLLWDTWLRVSEICNLETERVDLKKCLLVALTKGGNWEDKRFTPGTAKILKEWVEMRKRLAHQDCPTLFCNTITGLPLTRDGLRANFNHLQKRVGFKVSSHDFRRGGPCHAAEQGMPDRIGMLQGGWKDHKQYQHYTRGAQLRAADRWLPGNDLDEGSEDEG